MGVAAGILTPRPKLYGIEATRYCEQRSPPDGSVQLRQGWGMRQWMAQLPKARRKYDDSVGQQHDACEKPDGHCRSHGAAPLPEDDVQNEKHDEDNAGPYD